MTKSDAKKARQEAERRASSERYHAELRADRTYKLGLEILINAHSAALSQAKTQYKNSCDESARVEQMYLSQLLKPD